MVKDDIIRTQHPKFSNVVDTKQFRRQHIPRACACLLLSLNLRCQSSEFQCGLGLPYMTLSTLDLASKPQKESLSPLPKKEQALVLFVTITLYIFPFKTLTWSLTYYHQKRTLKHLKHLKTLKINHILPQRLSYEGLILHLGFR